MWISIASGALVASTIMIIVTVVIQFGRIEAYVFNITCLAIKHICTRFNNLIQLNMLMTASVVIPLRRF